MAELLRHRHPKGPATDRLTLPHRATSRLYPYVQVSHAGQIHPHFFLKNPPKKTFLLRAGHYNTLWKAHRAN